ncbi:hypothetical protein LEP3755_30940 [Leptolyngbya sp. NIES-3755]|nr:hypothetical protein LEP3755_30940 [Leptolyngbya sp. NIES-3755]
MLNHKAAKIVAGLMTLPTIALTPLAASAAKDDFSVYNSSGTTIVRLYVSSSGRTTWDDDVLGRSVLSPGESGTVTFADESSNQCLYDFRAIYANGRVSEQFGVNVCRRDGIRFR